MTFDAKQSIKTINESLKTIFGLFEEEEARVKAEIENLGEIDENLKESEKTNKFSKKLFDEILKDSANEFRLGARDKKFTYTIDKIDKSLVKQIEADKYPIGFIKLAERLEERLKHIEQIVNQKGQIDRALLNEIKKDLPRLLKQYDRKTEHDVDALTLKDKQLHEYLIRYIRFSLQDVVNLKKALRVIAEKLGIPEAAK